MPVVQTPTMIDIYSKNCDFDSACLARKLYFLHHRTNPNILGLTDPRCIRCHGEESVQAPKEIHPRKPVVLSGSTYCPKCKIRGDKDWKVCPKCGGPLIDLYKLMRHSAVNPDHRICRQCHFMEGDLQKTHIANVGDEFASEQDCLECHEGHNECSGCH